MRDHRFGKRLGSLLLALAMFCALVPAAAFPVRAASWADRYMDQLVGWGVLRGDVAGNLSPQRQITRAEFVTMVNRAFGYTEGGTTPFTDVTQRDWYADDIGFAYHNGYFKGTSATTASPQQPLTREEAVVLLCRNLRVPEKKGEALGFSDSRELAEWSRGYIQAASELGIVGGYEDGTFRPQNSITRGEVSAMLVRAVGNLVNKAGETSLGGVYGNVTVTTPGVRLRDTVIAGDLYLTGGVGLGDVLLENVNVLGRIVVSGAGEAHRGGSSILLRNVSADEMVVDSMSGQFVTIRAEGDTAIGDTAVRTSALLEDMTAEGLGLRRISTEGEGNLILQLAGNIEEVTNRAPGTALTMTQGKAASITMDEEGVGSALVIDNGGRVEVLNLDTATSVTGVGGIAQLNVSSGGSNVAQLPDEILIRPGATATIYGELMDAVSAKESSQEPRLLAGYPRTKNVAATSATAVFSANKRGTVHWAVTALADGSATEEDLLEPSGTPGKIIRQGTTAIGASNTETTANLSGLTPDGSYYLTAIMTDNRNQRSPLKIYAFSTPDNTTPAFATGYPYISKITKDSIQVAAMANKDCLLYYAILPQGSIAPTLADFKAGSISGHMGYGSMEVLKNSSVTFIVNSKTLKEQESYDVYLLLLDADGSRNSGVKKLTAKTVDGTPPLFLTDPEPNSINATSVGLITSLNENGTIYWAVVAHGEEYPKALAGQSTKPALTSDTAKMQVEYGMNCLRSGRVTATANRTVNFTVTGLQAQTAYDLYYMAKDTAGNYTAEVKMITIHTLDSEPPQISQVFSKTADEAGKEPRPDTDITIVFSEGVQDYSTGKIYWEVYNQTIDTTRTETEQSTARKLLADLLTNNIRLWDASTYPDVQVKVVTREQVQKGGLEGDWICYDGVVVQMKEGRTEFVFKNAATAATGEGNLSLSSGSTYYFQVENVADTSNNKNLIKPNPQNLPKFTTVFATVQLTQEGITNGGPTGVDVHMNFQVHPISASSVPENMLYDILFWSNQEIYFDLYVRVKNGSTPVNLDSLVKDLPSSAMAGNGWYKLGNMGIIPTDSSPTMGASVMANAFKVTAFPKLNDLNEKYTYEYALSITQIGNQKESSGWSQRVDIQVTVPAGPQNNLTAIANLPIQEQWELALKLSLDQGGVKAIQTPTYFNIFHQFSDNQAPYFRGNYPYPIPGDSFVNISLMLNRSGTVYYALVPVKSALDPNMGTYLPMKDKSGTDITTGSYPTETIPPKRGSGIDKKDRNDLFLSDPVAGQIARPDATWDEAIKTGSLSVGDAVKTFLVSGLMPQTTYYALFVTQGESGTRSEVYCYQFTTEAIATPTVTLKNESPNVVATTSTDAYLYWRLYASDSLFALTKSSFYSVITDADKKAEFEKAYKAYFPTADSYKPDTTDSTKTYPTVLDALLEVPTDKSVFDMFVSTDSAAYTTLLGIITGSQTDIKDDAGYGQESSMKQLNPTTLNCNRQGKMKYEVRYYLFAAARNAKGSIYGFKAIDNIMLIDSDPPRFDGAVTTLTIGEVYKKTFNKKQNGEEYVTFDRVDSSEWSNSPADYFYNGEIQIKFNKRIYQMDRNQSLKELTKENLKSKLGILGADFDFDVVKWDDDDTTSTITLKFTHAFNRCSITFFNDGTISDVNSHAYPAGQTLTLRFDPYQVEGEGNLRKPYPQFVASWNGQ